MLTIDPERYIEIMITIFAALGLIFLTSLVYFLGVGFEIRGFLIYCAVVVFEVIIAWTNCYVLIKKFNNKKCVFDFDSIKYLVDGKVVLEIKRQDIRILNYIGFEKAFLFQMGSGYLNIFFIGGDDCKPYLNSIMLGDQKVLAISMSRKTAKKVEEILKMKVNKN